ncbi:hypothetical protein AGMMS49949_00560 [Alphaproteobacteria bacterium]|nr:hypothetical protein AGMMS49949_00560 [Alphaproteobacteria bacterium]GHS95593.1 hypothetical protein AGMMS50296_0200 [Alphaproteobacteria bacterium]
MNAKKYFSLFLFVPMVSVFSSKNVKKDKNLGSVDSHSTVVGQNTNLPEIQDPIKLKKETELTEGNGTEGVDPLMIEAPVRIYVFLTSIALPVLKGKKPSLATMDQTLTQVIKDAESVLACYSPETLSSTRGMIIKLLLKKVLKPEAMTQLKEKVQKLAKGEGCCSGCGSSAALTNARNISSNLLEAIDPFIITLREKQGDAFTQQICIETKKAAASLRSEIFRCKNTKVDDLFINLIEKDAILREIIQSLEDSI